MYRVVSGGLTDRRFAEQYLEAMFRLRYRVFHERLGWDVKTCDGLEFDEYDDAYSRYLLITTERGVVGGWRLRPTSQPYMLQQAFSELLGGAPAPRDPKTWEVSRFAIETDGNRQTRFGLNNAAWELMRATARFALAHEISRYVMVASAGAERLYQNAGLLVHRFGPPRRIGRVTSVGCWIDIDDRTCQVLLGHALPLPRAA